MTDRPAGRIQRTGILAAILRVARGDGSGIAMFNDTQRAFLSSLIPLFALPAVVALATAIAGDVARAIVDLLASVCAVLLPPIISHALARGWGREAMWSRFAVAFNWCQFALSSVGLGLLIILGVIAGATGGAPASGLAVGALVVLCVGIVGYGLWLHWFVARAGLSLSGGRAALLVFAIYVGTFAVLLVRGLLVMDRG